MRSHASPTTLALVAAAFLGGPVNAQEEVWEHFETRYDKDGDGRITREEHGRGVEAFDNLDRDGDGVITEADFERRRSGGRGREAGAGGLARNLGEMFGTFLNRDGEPGLSKQEWEAMIASLEPDADGAVAADKLRGLTGLAGRGGRGRDISQPLDRDRDGVVSEADLRAVFAAMDGNGDGLVEQGVEIDMPPCVGELAPDFTLPLSDGSSEVTLSSFRGSKPVALIFGSYT